MFLVFWGYYPIFELSWQGRDPGEARTAAPRDRGPTASRRGGAAILVRNLIRILDVFLFPFLAVISMIVTARAQRLGDLAAGTLVVREARFTAPESVVLGGSPRPPGGGCDGAVGAGLRRDPVVPRPARIARPDGPLASRRAARVRHSAVASDRCPHGLADETMLEAVAQSYRQRFENGGSAS